MTNYDKLIDKAIQCGFTHCVPLDVGKLEFLQEVRDMCGADKCHSYNKNWSCPPACASLEEMRERIKSFSDGLLVQTVGEIEDSYDWDGIVETRERHKKNFGLLWDALRQEYASVYAMGAGACRLCEECTYPDAPCRFPEKMSASMEACGLFVSKVCTDNNLKYNYGQNNIAFTSCFLLE